MDAYRSEGTTRRALLKLGVASAAACVAGALPLVGSSANTVYQLGLGA